VSLDEQFPSPPVQQDSQAAPPMQQRTSGLAIAGLILAFLVAPLGFILSLIAVFKTSKGRSKGRGLAIAGIIISALIIAGGTTLVVVAANSTVADPGCVAGKAAIINGASNADANSLQTTVDGLNAAAAKAKHDNVRSAMKALADDYTQLLNATKTGNLPAGIQDKVTADAKTIDSLCSIGS
jgi:hypothetical protein